MRGHVKTISIDIVNKVLIQPYWLNDFDLGTKGAGGSFSQVLCEG
jgi:hypothetical protein